MRRRLIKPQARVDILEIWLHIAKDSVDNADRVNNDIEAAIQLLAGFPGIGHQRSDVRNKKYLFWSVDSHVIAYHYDDQKLTVERVVHGARDFKRLFK